MSWSEGREEIQCIALGRRDGAGHPEGKESREAPQHAQLRNQRHHCGKRQGFGRLHEVTEAIAVVDEERWPAFGEPSTHRALPLFLAQLRMASAETSISSSVVD